MDTVIICAAILGLIVFILILFNMLFSVNEKAFDALREEILINRQEIIANREEFDEEE